MNKNLEELKKVKSFCCPETMDEKTRKNIIPILEGFEKRLKAIEVELGIYTEEEKKNIKLGGTNPD